MPTGRAFYMSNYGRSYSHFPTDITNFNTYNLKRMAGSVNFLIFLFLKLNRKEWNIEIRRTLLLIMIMYEMRVSE